MVEVFQRFWDQKELENLLSLKYYQAIQFGRHYEVEEYEEEPDLEEEEESPDYLFGQRMPEILTEAGDMICIRGAGSIPQKRMTRRIGSYMEMSSKI